MASDDTTSDDSADSETEESVGTTSGVDFGEGAREKASEGDGEDDAALEQAAAEGTAAAEEAAAPRKSDGDSEEEEEYDPEKLPPLSERATMYGAWGCVGLLAVVLLVFFILIKSAVDKIDDYGAVASEEESGEEPGELPPAEEPEPEPPPVERTLEWPSAYPPARDAARVDDRPMLLVFTAEYATESIDVFDGVFTNADIEAYLDRYYQVVHIDMGAQDEEPDPSIALCEVEFLPHVCYLNPETEEKLNEDTTGMIGTGALLREIVKAHAAYEASADAE